MSTVAETSRLLQYRFFDCPGRAVEILLDKQHFRSTSILLLIELTVIGFCRI